MSGNLDKLNFLRRFTTGQGNKNDEMDQLAYLPATMRYDKSGLTSLIPIIMKDRASSRNTPGVSEGIYNLLQGQLGSKYRESDRPQIQLQDTFRLQGSKTRPTYVTADQLRRFGWNNVDDNMVRDLNEALERYEITTPVRIRHFISQCAQESNKGLWSTEQDFGDKAYFDRQKEFGYDRQYRGGGNIHLTRRPNYQAFAEHMNDPRIMEGADYVAANYPWTSAGFWWKENHMNELVDSLQGDSDSDVKRVTYRVNGGYNGLSDRQKYYKQSLEIFPDQ